jgi:hypothetical protein
MKKKSLVILGLFLFSLLTLSIVSAVWWNPLSWSMTGKTIADSNGLVSYYTFDKGDAYDNGGNNNGILKGTAKIENGNLVLDGQTNPTSIGGYVDTSSFLDIPSSMSVSTWVYVGKEPISYGRVVVGDYAYRSGTKDNKDKGWYLGVSYGDSQALSFQIFNDNHEYKDIQVPDFWNKYSGKWVHLTGVFDSGNAVKLYINGEEYGSTATDFLNISKSPVKVRIGARAQSANQGRWDGKIDNVRIYNKALSASEIKNIYDEEGAGLGVGGLVSYYTFDKGDASDLQGNNNGYFKDNAHVKDGRLILDGKNDYVGFTASEDFALPSLGFSLWIKKDGSAGTGDNSERLISTWRASGGSRLYLRIVGKYVEMTWYTGSEWKTVRSKHVVTDNKWHNIVVTHDGNIGTLYVDGNLEESLSAVITSQTYKNIVLGSYNGVIQNYNGSMDNVRIYNKALSASEIKSIYDEEGVGFEVSEDYTCIDSDGGLNYYEKGNVSIGGTTHHVDFCHSNGRIDEGQCIGEVAGSVEYSCPNGCEDGACVDTCSDFIEFMKNATDLEIEDRHWGLAFGNSNQGYHDSYHNIWFLNSYGSASLYIEPLEEGDYFENRLENFVSRNLCKKEIREIGGIEQQVYLCKNIWDLAYDSQDVESDNERGNLAVFWINGDNLFTLEVRNYDSWNCFSYEDCANMERYEIQQNQQNLEDALDNLINNNFEFESIYLDYEAEQFLDYVLSSCDSDLIISPSQGYVGSWQCKLQPALCPPHGYQTELCQRWNEDLGEYETREAQISCSPGICSGCYVPRWLGDSYRGEDKCIPYGFRFEQDSGEFEWINKSYIHGGYEEGSDRLFLNDIVNEADHIEVVIYSNNTMDLRVEEWGNSTHHLSVGDELNILDLVNFSLYDGSNQPIQFLFKVNGVYYDSDNYLNSYFDYTVVVETPESVHTYTSQESIMFNMYCDIDGLVKQQKSNLKDGSWASCQNNYECESNICSSGECVDLKSAIQEAGAVKSLAYRVLCRLANLFREEGYSQCVYNFLGETTSTSSGGSGGSSGGGSFDAGSSPPPMPTD